MLVDLGHHAQGVNIEQIVSLLHGAGRLGGFHFNDRKYGDDDLIVGSIDPYQLFRIFYEFVDVASPRGRTSTTIDQSHNVEPKIEAMIQTVLNLQESYAKALLVDRAALERAQLAATCWRRIGSSWTHSAATSGHSAQECGRSSVRRPTRWPPSAQGATPSASLRHASMEPPQHGSDH